MTPSLCGRDDAPHDGITAFRAIRTAAHPAAAEIPIIAMTANAFEEDAPPLCGGGMNAHLSKLIQMDVGIAAIARFCRKR